MKNHLFFPKVEVHFFPFASSSSFVLRRSNSSHLPPDATARTRTTLEIYAREYFVDSFESKHVHLIEPKTAVERL